MSMAASVMTSGTLLTQVWCADSWDSMNQKVMHYFIIKTNYGNSFSIFYTVYCFLQVLWHLIEHTLVMGVAIFTWTMWYVEELNHLCWSVTPTLLVSTIVTTLKMLE